MDATKTTQYPTELDRLMEEQGRRGDWLARQVGVDPATVSRWRKGHIGTAKETMARVALALGRRADEGPSLFSPQRAVNTSHQTTPEETGG